MTTKLIPLTKWNEFHTYPNEAGLRYLVFHRNVNGFNRCIRRVGRRILIDEAEFFAWIEAQNPQRKA